MRTTTLALAIIAMLVATSLTGRVEAAAGDLDTSFDLDGIASIDSSSIIYLTSVAIQADGKALVAGYTSSDFALARYNTDGKLDQSFGVGGKVTTEFGANAYAKEIAIRPDGRILLAGTIVPADGSGNNIALARYKVDGSLDTAFGAGGKAIFDLSSPVDASAVALQSDGKIVVAGSIALDSSAPAVDLFVARLTSSGSPDGGFGGGDGFEVTDFFNPRDLASDVVVQSDGKIVVAGMTNDELGSSFGYFNFDFCMARYNADGSLDTSFSGDGKVVTQAFGKGRTEALLLQANGKLVLAGTSSTSYDFGLIRYNANGSLDTSFGNGGFAHGGDGLADAAALQANGKIVVVGRAVGSPQNSRLARFNANGSLDTSFGANGAVTTDVDEYDHCTAVAIQGDGRIVTSIWKQHLIEGPPGSFTAYAGVAVARYLGDGPPQPADLSIQMTDSPDPVSLGQTLTYNITVTNSEFIYPTAFHVTWQDTLPAGTEFVALQAPAGWVVYEKPAVGGTGKVSCSSYVLQAGHSAEFTLAVRVRNAASGSTISNTAQVKSLTPDPVGSNNRKTVTTAMN
ncbi:MAG TPA: hypothetical protein VKA70_18875 [Blastocatellia bacterium]|nr:hypothetical protein [Blastocatellia bacterium]